MIKELIEDLTFARITLSQALTRAKIIAYQVNNSDLKNWIQSEINGYKDSELPEYRIISCSVFAEIFDAFRGGTRTILLDISELDKDLDSKLSFYKMRITQSIGTLEDGLKNDEDKSYGYEYFNQKTTQRLASMIEDGNSVTAVKRRIQLSELRYIIEQTRQKLLDTLLDLNDTFPNFENSFSNKESFNNEKVQTIINHNIYGNYANSNIGVGENISQNLHNQNNIQQLRKELEKLGVQKDDIEELENTIKNEPKEAVSKQILIWIGKIANKAVEKGIEIKIPQLIETISQYT